jgi:hypothetical protein
VPDLALMAVHGCAHVTQTEVNIKPEHSRKLDLGIKIREASSYTWLKPFFQRVNREVTGHKFQSLDIEKETIC